MFVGVIVAASGLALTWKPAAALRFINTLRYVPHLPSDTRGNRRAGIIATVIGLCLLTAGLLQQ